ncbi:NAC domain-containing protein 6-like [Mercurialis annua]|uniref:NAC domain-containing protein 6-like n=1 Tax=Mercurialis annua TaxID=3986 RepID=UPI00215DECB0|nr:NAC domain-containing protein 6-like [Mercurialis annua]
MSRIMELHLCGFQFEPRDDQIVHLYLLNKLCGTPLPCQGLIQDCDVYGDQEPWQIWDKLGGPTYNNDFLYVFSPLKRRAAGGSTFKRNVGSSGGTWHGEDTGKKFKVQGIGWTQKRFSYRNKKNECENGCWLMQEYCLDQSEETVVCRIKKNHKKRKDEDRADVFGSKRARSDEQVIGVQAVPVAAAEEQKTAASMEDVEFANYVTAQLQDDEVVSVPAAEEQRSTTASEQVPVTAATEEEIEQLEFAEFLAELQDDEVVSVPAAEEQVTAFCMEEIELANDMAAQLQDDEDLADYIRYQFLQNHEDRFTV